MTQVAPSSVHKGDEKENIPEEVSSTYVANTSNPVKQVPAEDSSERNEYIP